MTLHQVIEEEGLSENAARMGELFEKELSGLCPDVVLRMRGRGLFWAMVIDRKGGKSLLVLSSTNYAFCNNYVALSLLSKLHKNIVYFINLACIEAPLLCVLLLALHRNQRLEFGV